MKKGLFVAIAMFLLFVTLDPALALETTPIISDPDVLMTDGAIAKAVQLTAKANNLSDPNVVEPHQFLVFHLPDGSVESAEVLPVDFSRGRHDCLWRATLRLQEAKLSRARVALITAPSAPAAVTPTAATPKPAVVHVYVPEVAENTNNGFSLWPFLLALIAVMAAFGGFFGFHLFQRRKLDADRLPPVVPGGLSRDLPTALATERFRTSGTSFSPRAVTAGYFRRIGGGKLLGIVPDPRNYFVAEMGFAGGGVHSANVVEGETFYQYSDTKGSHMYSRFSCGNYATKLVIPAGWEFVEGAAYRPSPEILAQQEKPFTPMIGKLDVMSPPDGSTENGEGTVMFVSGQPGEFVRPEGSEVITPAPMPKGDVIVPDGGAVDPVRHGDLTAEEMAGFRGWSMNFLANPDLTFAVEVALPETRFCTKCGLEGNPGAKYCRDCGTYLLAVADPAIAILPETEKKVSGGLPETVKKSRYVESIPSGAMWGLPEKPVEGLVMVEPTPAKTPNPEPIAPAEPKKLISSITIKGEDGKESTVVIEQDPNAKPITRIRRGEKGDITVDFPRDGVDG